MGGRSVVPGREARMKLGLGKGDKRQLTGFGKIWDVKGWGLCVQAGAHVWDSGGT